MIRLTVSRALKFTTVIFVLFTVTYYVGRLARNEQSRAHEDNMLKYRSYEDLELAYIENQRVGPGEQGRDVRLTTEQMKKAKQFTHQNGFNIYVSDMIALDRSVADIRYQKCKTMKYLSHLPQTSVVIPFFEEHFSTLLRTVIGSLKRSPPGLIKEVILVDDGSSRHYLKDQLDKYIRDNFPKALVWVLRLPYREGLIRARIHGARAATGDAIVFLDSHCEPNSNWLPPLLDPIAKDYKTVTCPFIDVINTDSFQYRAQDEGARGAFDWELFYKRLPRLAEDENHPEQPFASPVMAGGLFAISARWFWELGGYDPGLMIWGGEQYELSFKIWMCGGTMIDIPCSRIGHLYRTYPTNFPQNTAALGDFVGKNYKRVAEVWMDEYKEFIYQRRPHYRALDPGNLTDQYAIRQRLKCKSFKWFMTEVAFDLTKKYPTVIPPSAATGDIRPAVDQSFCIDAFGASPSSPIKLSKCIRDATGSNGIQNFELSFMDDIRPLKMTECIDQANAQPSAAVVLFPCHGGKGNQHWAIQSVHGDRQNPVRIMNVPSQVCLEADTASGKVVINPCGNNSRKMHWIWQTIKIDKT